MQEFNNTAVKQLRCDLEAVLKNAGITGVTLEVGNIRYSATEATIKLQATVVGAERKVDRDLAYHVKRLGLVIQNASGDKLVQYKATNHKYPFIFERNGKSYKCSPMRAECLFAK